MINLEKIEKDERIENCSHLKKSNYIDFKVTKDTARRFRRLAYAGTPTEELFLRILNILERYPTIQEEILNYDEE